VEVLTQDPQAAGRSHLAGKGKVSYPSVAIYVTIRRFFDLVGYKVLNMLWFISDCFGGQEMRRERKGL
jgi:hypothetical protein